MSNFPLYLPSRKKTVTGKVTDTSGESLPGVSVVVKGTTIGTITDIEGNFSLEIPGDAKSLSFSFVGMESQEIIIANQTSFSIKMIEVSVGIEEVVAIGYGTVKKSDLTGSLTSVTSANFKDQNVTRVDQVLQGRASGVQISNTVGGARWRCQNSYSRSQLNFR